MREQRPRTRVNKGGGGLNKGRCRGLVECRRCCSVCGRELLIRSAGRNLIVAFWPCSPRCILVRIAAVLFT